jgi:hypothetical protein
LFNIYRPVLSDGILSTYQQHRAVLLDSGIDICPRQKVLNDLSSQLKTWLAEGLQIVVAGDFNDAIRGKTISKFFRDLNMRELITNQHGTSAPNTY